MRILTNATPTSHNNDPFSTEGTKMTIRKGGFNSTPLEEPIAVNKFESMKVRTKSQVVAVINTHKSITSEFIKVRDDY